MSTRTSKVEALLRREIAAALLRGDLRDPRLSEPAGISVTGVSVSPDLSLARVFVDVMGERPSEDVVAGLNAAAGALRGQFAGRLRIRRVPRLIFESDQSIERGAAIERVLAELAREGKS